MNALGSSECFVTYVAHRRPAYSDTDSRSLCRCIGCLPSQHEYIAQILVRYAEIPVKCPAAVAYCTYWCPTGAGADASYPRNPNSRKIFHLKFILRQQHRLRGANAAVQLTLSARGRCFAQLEADRQITRISSPARENFAWGNCVPVRRIWNGIPENKAVF